MHPCENCVWTDTDHERCYNPLNIWFDDISDMECKCQYHLIKRELIEMYAGVGVFPENRPNENNHHRINI